MWTGFSGMEGTGTYGLRLKDYRVDASRLIADPAKPFIARIRAVTGAQRRGLPDVLVSRAPDPDGQGGEDCPRRHFLGEIIHTENNSRLARNHRFHSGPSSLRPDFSSRLHADRAANAAAMSGRRPM